MALRIFPTSPMSVEVGDRVVDAMRPGRPQVRLALAFLVTQRHRAVSRHELADVLWAQGLPTTWEAALRVVVSKVRRVFTALDLGALAVTLGGAAEAERRFDEAVATGYRFGVRRWAVDAEEARAAGRPRLHRRHCLLAGAIAP